MIKFYISILIILNTINIYGFQKVSIEINEYEKNYVEFLSINDFPNDSLLLEVLNHNKIKIHRLSSLNSETDILEILKNKNKSSYIIIKSDNENFEVREIFVLEDQDQNKYNLVLAFYSKMINVDSINKNFDIEYNKKEYPIRLISNSHVIGNFLIYDEEEKLISEFELLDSFYLILASLKKGTYQVYEDDKDNPLLKLNITD